MTRRSQKILSLAAALAVAASRAWAQADPVPEGAAAAPQAKIKAPPAQAPHAVSAETTALLAADRPKYSPPKAEPPKPPPTPEEQLLDLRDVDKPKNKIVRLPKVVVVEKPSPIFSEREIQSKKNLTDLALKRYVTDVNGMPKAAGAATKVLFSDYALEQYQEDERLNRMGDIKASSNLFKKAGDKAEADALTNSSRDAFLQRGDFGSTAPDQASSTNSYQYLKRQDATPAP